MQTIKIKESGNNYFTFDGQQIPAKNRKEVKEFFASSPMPVSFHNDLWQEFKPFRVSFLGEIPIYKNEAGDRRTVKIPNEIIKEGGEDLHQKIVEYITEKEAVNNIYPEVIFPE